MDSNRERPFVPGLDCMPSANTKPSLAGLGLIAKVWPQLWRFVCVWGSAMDSPTAQKRVEIPRKHGLESHKPWQSGL